MRQGGKNGLKRKTICLTILDCPSDATEYPVSNRVNAVAIDGPSIDRGVDNHFNSHNILLSKGIPVIENLCNLEQLRPATSFTIIINPLKLVGASGSPVRAIAVL